MYQKIISAVDGSFHSELASRHAIAVASSCGSELVVLAVDTGEQEDLSSSIKRVCRHARKNGIHAKGMIRKGEVIKTILDVIDSENADLLMGATRHDEHRLFVRSITQKLMLKAPCSMIAVKPAGITIKGNKMLLPVARKEQVTDEAALLVLCLAKFYKQRVEVMHVVERRHWYNLPWEKLYTMRHHGIENMMPVARALAEKGIDVEVRAVVAESSVNAILREAAIGKHSLVLLRASQRGVLKQIVSGNPIEQILSRVPCDVLIWRPGP